jgi:hypothetical protein
MRPSLELVEAPSDTSQLGAGPRHRARRQAEVALDESLQPILPPPVAGWQAPGVENRHRR